MLIVLNIIYLIIHNIKWKLKEINIKNRTNYFYNDIITFDEYDENKISVDKKDFNDINISYLSYKHKKKISECNVINSVNPRYLRIINMSGQFEKGKDMRGI